MSLLYVLKKKSVFFYLFFLLTVVLFCTRHSNATTQQSTSTVKQPIQVVSLGKGKIALFWPPALSLYNGGGWQLQDSSSKKVLARWTTEDLLQGLSTFSPERQEKLRPFIERLGTEKDQKKAKGQLAWLFMGGMADFSAARRLGFASVLSDLPIGSHSYSLTLLNTKNTPTRNQISSPPIDAWKPSPLPPPVTNLRGISSTNGVQLYWNPTDKQSFPVPAVQIFRTGDDGREIPLSADPIWNVQEADQAAFIDNTAPPESELTYTVRGIDIFGRYSEPASVTLLNKDLAALKPPVNITVTPGTKRADISWKISDNPHTASYVVERSRRANGIYELLTPKGLSRKTNTFRDKTVQSGFSYYYRVRSVGMRGEVGQAPLPVSVVIKTESRPEAPKKLHAKISPITIHLSWKPEPLPVCGYIVEKKTAQSNTWVRLNSSLTTLPQFDDKINLGDFGTRNYRITAVSFDNQKSKKSKELTVKLPGHPPIAPPFLADISSEPGMVRLKFKAAIPRNRTAKLLLVRGNSQKDLGLVIDNDIDGSETEYEDHRVKPGEDYWYALIAVDKTEHFSKMGNKLFIVVQSTEIPQPERPDLKFEAEPFRRVIISFEQPDGYLLTSVMRKIEQGQWTTVAREIAGTDTIVDADPPLTGTVHYRVAYLDESKHWGEPSESTPLTFDK